MRYLLISKEEVCPDHFFAMCDKVLYWDDYLDIWSICLVNDRMPSIYMGDIKHELNPGDVICMRRPYLSDSYILDVCHLLEVLYPWMLSSNIGDTLPQISKPIQLATIKEHPKTIITNRYCLVEGLPKNSIVKSMSSVRSQVQYLDAISQLNTVVSDGNLTPFLIQDYVDGEEYKCNFLYKGGQRIQLNVKIEKQSIDYRYDSKTHYVQASNPPEPINIIADFINENFGINTFDLDYIVRENEVFILEWNNLSASHLFESMLECDTTFSQYSWFPELPVYVGSTEDNTLHDTFYPNSTDGILLYYEDLNRKWKYKLISESLIITIGDKHVIPSAIYDRGTSFNSNDKRYEMFNDWCAILTLPKINVIPKPQFQFSNNSKPYQYSQIHSENSVRCPNTTITNSRDHMLKLTESATIVKSLSGIRSVVINQDIWSDWIEDTYFGVPAMFQQCVFGDDIRVHATRDKTFSVKVINKRTTDYRYGDEFCGFESIDLPKSISDYCSHQTLVESLPLVGIDLMRSDDDEWYYLETNLCPGWSYFYQEMDDVRYNISQEIRELMNHA